MSETNFLIGRGELLAYDIKGPRTMPGKTEVYTLKQAKAALVPQAVSAGATLTALPDATCPGGMAVAKVAMHPTYIAKSFFPSALLQAAGLTTVGSRAADLPLRSMGRSKRPRSTTTTEIFVAGNKDSFRRLADASVRAVALALVFRMAKVRTTSPSGARQPSQMPAKAMGARSCRAIA